ncbi:hypothetical protein GUJ93_ZPchr0012g21534 [Zizania palustris]|uniref:Uncharacterized protein n=1 Tax=Zizania palustris TaxID=103762 RepID=A0A8J5WPI5_ZIZPA|nr:hypothetical protein GUJ93_ZPchr0012g21534 [Zizania palustris]
MYPKILRYDLDSMAMIPHTAGSHVGESTVSMLYLVLSPMSYTASAIKVEVILDAQGLWEAVAPADGAVIDDKKNKTEWAQLLQALPDDILMQVATKLMAK